MTTLDAKVLEKAMQYNDLLNAMVRYVPTYDELLQSLPKRVPEELRLFVQRVKSDINFIKKLDIPKLKSKAPVIARHYDLLGQYFAEKPEEFIGGGYAAISVLDHLGFFVRSIEDIGGKVSWIPTNEYVAIQEGLEERLNPLFEQTYAWLRDGVPKILRKTTPTAEALPNTLSITPLLSAASAIPEIRGMLYLLQVSTPSFKIHRVLFDIGQQRQIEFCDLSEPDSEARVEPDRGYMVDTLADIGYLPIMKQRLELALEKINIVSVINQV